MPALGYVVSYGDLSKALKEEINQSSLVKISYEFEVSAIENKEDKSILYGRTKNSPLETPLLILADGGKNNTD